MNQNQRKSEPDQIVKDYSYVGGKKTCWLCVATAVVMLTVTIHQQCSLLFDFLFFQSCNQLEALVGPGSRNGPFGQGDSDTMSKMCYIKDQNYLHIIREYIHIRKMSSTFHLKKHKDWDKVTWRRRLKPHWKKMSWWEEAFESLWGKRFSWSRRAKRFKN